MLNLYLCQPNFRFGIAGKTGYWIPYSIGCLWSYASQFEDIKQNVDLKDIIFRRENVDTLVDRLEDPDIIAFSCYMWNWEWSKAVAQRVKQRYPKCKIVFGGPQVTDRPEEEEFFKHHKYVDSISLAEGEQSFTDILRNLISGKLIEKIYNYPRLDELDIPSPYLTGVFEKIIADNPGVLWNGTLETNRGCPFACTFCDWGGLTYSKLKKFPEEKVLQELHWMAHNKMDYVTIADANFGVFTDRDMKFTEELVELQKEYGYPQVVDATWYKNSSEEIMEIVKKFISSGFNRGLTLSVQSMDMDVLEEIKRRNMEFSNLKHIFDICNREQIPSYTELILGLPKETFESWSKGLCDVIEMGQHNAIESWLAQLLENAHLNSPGQRTEHEIDTVVVKDYISGFEEEDGISESVTLVRGTKDMPMPKFIDSWMYAWMINNFHNYGWTQILSRFLRKYKDMSYFEFYNRLWVIIQEDDGYVKQLFDTAKAQLTEYLETGIADGFSGHTLMWSAQSDFHKEPLKIFEFIDKHYSREWLDLPEKYYPQLMKLQTFYVTHLNVSYPTQMNFGYNFMEYINDEEAELVKDKTEYTLDLIMPCDSEEEYMDRMYYKRRQGWGKVLIST
jgi:putative methyltransferase